MRLIITNVQVVLNVFVPFLILSASPAHAIIEKNQTERENPFYSVSETSISDYDYNPTSSITNYDYNSTSSTTDYDYSSTIVHENTAVKTSNEANEDKGSRLVVNKCCKFNQTYDYKNGSCVDLKMERFNNINASGMLMTADTLTNMPWWNQGVESAGNSSSQPVDAVFFQLKISMPDCAESEMIKKIVHKDAMSQCHTPQDGSSLDESSLLLTTSGYLVWRSATGLMNALPYTDFCLDQVNDTAFIAMMCKEACTPQKPCVRKCCPPEMAFDKEISGCLPAKAPWVPNLYDGDLNEIQINPKSILHPRYEYGAPPCSDGRTQYNAMNPSTDIGFNKFKTIVNGSIIVDEVVEGSYALGPSQYCTDVVLSHDATIEGSIESVVPIQNDLDQVVLICYNPESTDDKPKWKYTVHGIGALISATFLTLTAIVYLITWTNFHGWLQFAYVVSLLQAFLFLGILQLASDTIQEYSSSLCEVLGSILHFSFLSALFWLTSMNFDIWWTFSGYRPLTARSRGGEIRRYLFFGLFSWGCASLIAGTGLTLDLLYKSDDDSTIIRPRFGERKCYFAGYKEQLPYLYGPMGVLLLIDLCFFLNTVYSLHKLQQDTRFATQQSSRQEKKKFILFVKLFVVMGILWTFELLSWIVTVYDTENRKTWDNVFFIFDVINSGQGLLIFIIFTCKPNTCRQLEGQFKKFAVFLEKRRDKGIGQSVWVRTTSCIGIAVIMLTLPIIHLLRNMFSYCGRRQRSTVGRQRTQTTTMTFDKFRKTSNSSTSTSLSLKDPGAYELGVSSLHI